MDPSDYQALMGFRTYDHLYGDELMQLDNPEWDRYRMCKVETVTPNPAYL